MFAAASKATLKKSVTIGDSSIESENIEFLIVENISEPYEDNFELFRKKVQKISGIAFTVTLPPSDSTTQPNHIIKHEL